MRTLKLTLAYDGGGYAGWQRQKDAVTIQGKLEAAFTEIEGQPVTVHGAGRTDAGVHALGQVASVRLVHAINLMSLTRALNAKLPDDICVLCVETATEDFHARFSARSKAYQYRVSLGSVPNPLERGHAWHVRQSLDFEKIRQAAVLLRGRHDFAAFRAASGDYPSRSTVRTITELEIKSDLAPAWLGAPARPVLVFDVVGDGFLRHMVRTLVGTLIEVGAGRFGVDDVAEILLSRRREQAGPTAPAHGLFLVRVEY